MFPNDTLKTNECYNCPLCKEFLTGYELILHLVDNHEANLKNAREDYEVFSKVKTRFINGLPKDILPKVSDRLLNAITLCHILGQETLGKEIIEKAREEIGKLTNSEPLDSKIKESWPIKNV